jgi:hypothetical protein
MRKSSVTFIPATLIDGIAKLELMVSSKDLQIYRPHTCSYFFSTREAPYFSHDTVTCTSDALEKSSGAFSNLGCHQPHCRSIQQRDSIFLGQPSHATYSASNKRIESPKFRQCWLGPGGRMLLPLEKCYFDISIGDFGKTALAMSTIECNGYHIVRLHVPDGPAVYTRDQSKEVHSITPAKLIYEKLD